MGIVAKNKFTIIRNVYKRKAIPERDPGMLRAGATWSSIDES